MLKRYDYRILLFVSGFMILNSIFLSCKEEKRYTDPLTVNEALTHFKIADGFQLEVFAAEPYVMSPVDLMMDEQGITYVIEMGDYPYKPEPGKAKGRIRVLQDTDNDGRIDHSIVFADQLPSATSLLPWKGGVVVTAAPDILYLKDTTGDHIADVKEVLFTGFFEDNSEAQITSMRFGIDNWIYANNNGQKGKITSPKNPGHPVVNISGGDFRFRLDTILFEKESGTGQFGQALDDWGNRFYTQNTLHIQQPAIKGKYLQRHGFMPTDKVDVNISDHELEMFQLTPPPYWRLERSNRRQKNYDEMKLDRREWADDHFTGASGGTFYGGDTYPSEYYGSVFTGEVAGNLVHRDIISPRRDKPVFIAQRAPAEKDREFIASDDPWFRPVNLWLGPDGNLYLIDMYLQHIETPVSIPDDLKADMNFAAGDTMGRIYKIVSTKNPVNGKPVLNLRGKTSEELVGLLAHPNQWWRLQAQRLLLERQDKTVIKPLQQMFDTHTDPRARLHALYALDGLGQMNAGLVSRALKDGEMQIRKHACMLAERYPSTFSQLVTLTNDSSIHVAFQATLSLGGFPAQASGPVLISVLEEYGSEPLFRSAILSSEAGSSVNFIKLLLNKSKWMSSSNDDNIAFAEDFGFISGARNRKEDLLALMDLLSENQLDGKIRVAMISGLAKGIKSPKNKHTSDDAVLQYISKWKTDEPNEMKTALEQLKSALGDTLKK